MIILYSKVKPIAFSGLLISVAASVSERTWLRSAEVAS